MWIVADNLRKGAATNAIQLAELLHERQMLGAQRTASPRLTRLGRSSATSLEMGGDDLLGGAAHAGQVPARAVGGAQRPSRPGTPPRRAGEIRITRVEPEQLVEWEAENRIGTVQIKPSGWGTKVTLTVASEVAETTTAEEPAAFEATEPAPIAGHEPAPFAKTEPAALAEDEPAALRRGRARRVGRGRAGRLRRGGARRVGRGRARVGTEEPAAAEQSVPSRLGAPLTAAAASSWRAETEPAEAEDPRPGWIAEDADALPPAETRRGGGRRGIRVAARRRARTAARFPGTTLRPLAQAASSGSRRRRGFASGGLRRGPGGRGFTSGGLRRGPGGRGFTSGGLRSGPVAEAAASAAEGVPECEPPAREDPPEAPARQSRRSPSHPRPA